MKLVLTAVCAFLLLIAASGQEATVKFTVNEALDYALEHNKTLKNAKDDVKLAYEQRREARGAGLPKVDATVDYMTNFNYAFNLDFGSGSTEPPQINYELLDLGDYEVLSAINQMFGSSGPSSIILTDQASANIQVSQLIFNGQYWVGMQLAKLGQEIRENNLTLTETDIKEQVINLYYLILVTEKSIQVFEENIVNLNEIYKHTSNMFMAGMAEQTDVDQLRINLSQLQNSKNETERTLQLAYNTFRLRLGLESEEDIILTQNLDQLIEVAEVSALRSESFNINDNPTYKLMSIQEDIGNKQIDMQRWAFSPTLVGFYSYREKILTSGFDLSPNNAAGLSLSVPIISGGTKQAQLNQAKIEYDKIKRNKSLISEQLMLQDKQLSFELKSAFDNYVTQKENIDVALRFYNSFQNKYKQGMISSLELTQANSNYLQAQGNYFLAVLKLLQSQLALDKLYNKI